MAYAPTPKFTQQQDQPIVIQNRMPKAGDAEFTGTMPSLGGNNSTFRLVGTNQAGATTPTTTSRTSTNPYPMGYTSGIPQGVDTVSGPGASYTPASSNTGNTNGNNNPNNPGTDKPSTGPRADWVNPNLSPGTTRPTQDWKGIYTAPANNPGTYDPNDIGRGIGWGQSGGWDPNTPSPGTTGTGGGGFTPRGENMTTSVGNSSGMQTRTTSGGNQATYSRTTDDRGGNNGGGGSPYLGPPGLGGGGQQQGGGAPWTPRPDYSTQDRGPLADMLRGRVGYYHPGTGISTAGTPYANPGYGNPAGQWTPGYQAPSWLGGGYRGGSGGGGGGGQDEPPPRQGPGGNVMYGNQDFSRRDIRNMDSGSGPSGSGNTGGGGGGGWVTVGTSPGQTARTAAPSGTMSYGYTGGYGYPNGDTLSGPGAGPYSPGGGPDYQGPPNQVPPYPTFDLANPPSPQELLQLLRNWWAQVQAANPSGAPGPNFPGMVPTGATGVQSVYPPGAWERMQAIWPRGGNGGGQDGGGPSQDKNPGTGEGQDPNPGYTPPTYTPPDPRPPWGGEPGGGGNPGWPGPTPGGPWTSPVMTGGFGYDYLKSQRPGSGPGR